MRVCKIVQSEVPALLLERLCFSDSGEDCGCLLRTATVLHGRATVGLVQALAVPAAAAVVLALDADQHAAHQQKHQQREQPEPPGLRARNTTMGCAG